MKSNNQLASSTVDELSTQFSTMKLTGIVAMLAMAMLSMDIVDGLKGRYQGRWKPDAKVDWDLVDKLAQGVRRQV